MYIFLVILRNLYLNFVYRSSWYGSTHDVHNSIPVNRKSGPGRLETTKLGLQLVLYVSTNIIRIIVLLCSNWEMFILRTNNSRKTIMLDTLIFFSSLAWSSFTACMASSVTTINRYTKTIMEFKHKRKNMEKNLKIKQKLLDLESPEQVWDMYISSVPSTAEEFLDLSSSGRKLSTNSVFLDLNDLPSPQGEEYC